MTVFEHYAQVYDLIYAVKDYKAEAFFISHRLRFYREDAQSLLEVGCGSGRHSRYFEEQNWQVLGIDQSADMLKAALKNTNGNLSFIHADMRTLNLRQNPIGSNVFNESATSLHPQAKFDAIAAPFHVFSYQVSNVAILEFLKSATLHMRPNGLLYIDFWLAEAVLAQKPEKRVLEVENKDLKVRRHATPIHEPAHNRVRVCYDFEIFDKNSQSVRRFSEEHPMRYFSVPEIELILKLNGFALLEVAEFMSQKTPSENTWNVYAVARLQS